jgi:hypothetical protein
MNKKANTALFLLGATVANILVMLILLAFGFVLLSTLLPEDTNPQLGQILFLLVFLGSIGGSFFFYHKIMKVVSRKVDMDKYFHPIFSGGKKKDTE